MLVYKPTLQIAQAFPTLMLQGKEANKQNLQACLLAPIHTVFGMRKNNQVLS